MWNGGMEWLFPTEIWGQLYTVARVLDSWVLENSVLSPSICTFCLLTCLFSMSLEKLEPSNRINKLALKKAGSVGQHESLHYIKFQSFSVWFHFHLPPYMNASSEPFFFSLAIVILIDVSRNSLRLNFPTKKAISFSLKGIWLLLKNRKIYIRYKMSWVVQVNRRLSFGNSQD